MNFVSAKVPLKQKLKQGFGNRGSKVENLEAQQEKAGGQSHRGGVCGEEFVDWQAWMDGDPLLQVERERNDQCRS